MDSPSQLLQRIVQGAVGHLVDHGGDLSTIFCRQGVPLSAKALFAAGESALPKLYPLHDTPTQIQIDALSHLLQPMLHFKGGGAAFHHQCKIGSPTTIAGDLVGPGLCGHIGADDLGPIQHQGAEARASLPQRGTGERRYDAGKGFRQGHGG